MNGRIIAAAAWDGDIDMQQASEYVHVCNLTTTFVCVLRASMAATEYA